MVKNNNKHAKISWLHFELATFLLCESCILVSRVLIHVGIAGLHVLQFPVHTQCACYSGDEKFFDHHIMTLLVATDLQCLFEIYYVNLPHIYTKLRQEG